MRFTVSLLFCLTLSLAAARTPVMDERAARDYCDREILDEVEGIWHYVEDDVKVLVSRDKDGTGNYRITVLETPDCRVSPGDVIGRLVPSADRRQFRMELYTDCRSGLLTDTRECLATLGDDGNALLIKARKLKLKLRLRGLSLLPRFWRLVSIGYDKSDPLEKLPRGMVRIYPSFDGDGSGLRAPRYL